MNTISAVIIAKNEEKMIEGALKSLSFCEDVIVVDNGSKDKTKKIAEQNNAKVYEHITNDFSQIRNFGLAKATGDWILYLDADERIDEVLQKSIKKVVSESTKYSGFKLLRKNFYFGEKEWPHIEKLERLFKKEALKGWKGKIHESPEVEGDIGQLDGYILHFTHRDLASMLDKTIEWSTVESLLRYNANHPEMTWWRFPRVMITAFLNSYIKQGGYKAGTAGLIESIYQAFSIFITYAKLWEIQNKQNLKHKT